MKIYGPYKRKDKRSILILYVSKRDKTTISLPKHIMECYLDRKLTENETIDHIDGNVENNSIANFQVLGRLENTDKYLKNLGNIKCLSCSKEIQKTQHSMKFCSIKCKDNWYNSGREVQ